MKKPRAKLANIDVEGTHKCKFEQFTFEDGVTVCLSVDKFKGAKISDRVQISFVLSKDDIPIGGNGFTFDLHDLQ